ELVQVRLADVHVPRRFQPLHGGRGAIRHVVAKDRRPVGGADPGSVEDVLDGESGARWRILDDGDEDVFEAAARRRQAQCAFFSLVRAICRSITVPISFRISGSPITRMWPWS